VHAEAVGWLWGTEHGQQHDEDGGTKLQRTELSAFLPSLPLPVASLPLEGAFDFGAKDGLTQIPGLDRDGRRRDQGVCLWGEGGRREGGREGGGRDIVNKVEYPGQVLRAIQQVKTEKEGAGGREGPRTAGWTQVSVCAMRRRASAAAKCRVRPPEALSRARRRSRRRRSC